MPRFLIEYAASADSEPVERLHVDADDIVAAEAEARSHLAAIKAASAGAKPIGHRIMTGLGAVVRAWRPEDE